MTATKPSSTIIIPILPTSPTSIVSEGPVPLSNHLTLLSLQRASLAAPKSKSGPKMPWLERSSGSGQCRRGDLGERCVPAILVDPQGLFCPSCLALGFLQNQWFGVWTGRFSRAETPVSLVWGCCQISSSWDPDAPKVPYPASLKDRCSHFIRQEPQRSS